jgi:L-cysteine desulfidase
VDQEHLVRALTLSHLTALYIHSFLPVLSAFCATASAAMGAAAGTVYLRTGNYQAAAAAIKNMCGDVVGMVCDGAGCSCAMKVANSAATMCRAVKLALAGVVIPATNGLVAEDVDQTLRGIGQLATIGMKETDPAILKVMLNK